MTYGDRIASRIDALPVNPAHRAAARAHYMWAEATVRRTSALHAATRMLPATCRRLYYAGTRARRLG
jgi:hypothetical protein